MPIFDVHHPWVFTFGVLGNIVSILVYLAPLPTFIQICKSKSTLGYQSVPYVVALFSALLWIYYSFLKPDAVLLISINAFGIIIETCYVFIFLAYASKEARKQTMKLISSLIAGAFSLIFLVTLFFVKGPNRIVVVGWICVAVSVSVFAAPLSIVFQVVRTRSVEFMPFTLSFFLTMTAIMWFAYGFLQNDLCIALPNVFGFILGLLQMMLYGIYKNGKGEDLTEKKFPVKLAGGSEVHPVVDAPRASCNSVVIDIDGAVANEEEKRRQKLTDKHGDDDDDDDNDNDNDCANTNKAEESSQKNVELEPSPPMPLESPPLLLVVCAA